MKVGDRVKFHKHVSKCVGNGEIDISGTTGTITHLSGIFAVKLDGYWPVLAEWDGEVIWCEDDLLWQHDGELPPRGPEREAWFAGAFHTLASQVCSRLTRDEDPRNREPQIRPDKGGNLLVADDLGGGDHALVWSHGEITVTVYAYDQAKGCTRVPTDPFEPVWVSVTDRGPVVWGPERFSSLQQAERWLTSPAAVVVVASRLVLHDEDVARCATLTLAADHCDVNEVLAAALHDLTGVNLDAGSESHAWIFNETAARVDDALKVEAHGQLDDIVRTALDAAVGEIQGRLGVKTGDFASHWFDEATEAPLRKALRAYAKAEILNNSVNDNPSNQGSASPALEGALRGAPDEARGSGPREGAH